MTGIHYVKLNKVSNEAKQVQSTVTVLYTSFVHHSNSNTDARHVSDIKLHGTEILGESCFVCCKVSQ